MLLKGKDGINHVEIIKGWGEWDWSNQYYCDYPPGSMCAASIDSLYAGNSHHIWDHVDLRIYRWFSANNPVFSCNHVGDNDIFNIH